MWNLRFLNAWQTEGMLETSVRLLRLLSLLQVRRDWSGADLASRLGVTTRTVRNDVERLRILGYEVHSSTGITGGYRLGAGSAMPPLLLDDDEAVAVGVGLRAAAAGTVTGIEETSLRALAKLEQTLPARLRRRLDALRQATVSAAGGGPTVDAETLTTIAGACRDHEQLRFDYRGRDGETSARRVEPHRLVYTGRRWYLLAWDRDREDWRTFRADRIRPRLPTGPRFTPREPPEDAASHVVRGTGSLAWTHQARVRLHAPAEVIAESASRRRPACCARSTSTAASWRPAATPCVTSSATSRASTSRSRCWTRRSSGTMLRKLADRYTAAAGDRDSTSNPASSRGHSAYLPSFVVAALGTRQHDPRPQRQRVRRLPGWPDRRAADPAERMSTRSPASSVRKPARPSATDRRCARRRTARRVGGSGRS